MPPDDRLTSPLFRALAGVRVVAGAASDVAEKLRRGQCLNCPNMTPTPARGAVRQKLCEECVTRASDAGAGILADAAEGGMRGLLREVFGGKKG